MATGIILPGTKLVKLPKSGAAWGGVTGDIDLQLDLKTKLDSKVNLTGGSMTGALGISSTSGESLLLKKATTSFLRFRDSGLLNGAVAECMGSSYGGQLLLSSASGGCYLGRRDSTSLGSELGFEAFIGNYNGSGINIKGTGFYAFGASNGSNLHSIRNAAFYYGGAPNTIQMGANHATVATKQCLKGHNVTTGDGGAMEIAGGTGSGSRGAVTLNGGGRVVYTDPPSGYDFTGSDTISSSVLSSWHSQVNASLSVITQTLINHGLMAAA